MGCMGSMNNPVKYRWGRRNGESCQSTQPIDRDNVSEAAFSLIYTLMHHGYLRLYIR